MNDAMKAATCWPPPDGLPAITLWQPWASWIAAGWKWIETRPHNRFAPLVGRTIAIHAGRKWDRDWLAKAGSWLGANRADRTEQFRNVRGVVVCTVQVVEARRLAAGDSLAALCDCSGGRLSGLGLAGVRAFADPPPARGRQYIWRWRPSPDVPAPKSLWRREEAAT